MITRRCLLQFATLLLAQLGGVGALGGGRPQRWLSDERGSPLITESGEPIGY
jgi:hypothetical protein